jgi:hypothetical protein
MLGTHLFVLLNVSQAGLELAVAAMLAVVVAALKFSQCNVLRGRYPWSWSSGC